MERIREVIHSVFGCCNTTGGVENEPLKQDSPRRRLICGDTQDMNKLNQAEDLQQVLIILNYYKLELFTFLPQAAEIIKRKSDK